MALRPYEEIIGQLVIPVRGKEYPLPPVSLQDGLRLHASAHGGEAVTLEEMTTIILGDTRQQMLDDGVPVSVIDRALWTGIADYQHGREMAEYVWEHGAPKEVLEELTKVLIQAQTTRPAAATTTPPQASGNGTTTRKKTAIRSRGSKSSTSGA